MIADRPVRCESALGEARDRNGKFLGFCRAGCAAFNLGMVRDGHALALRRYFRGKAWAAAYLAVEGEARAARRGMRAGRSVAPRDWQRGER